MEVLIRDQLKKMFKKAKNFHLPTNFDDIDFTNLEFFGWVDTSSDIAYTVFKYKGKLEGIVWKITRLSKVALKPAFCEICKRHRNRSEVMLVAAKTKKLPKGIYYRTKGNYICSDLVNCAQEAEDVEALERLYKAILEDE